MLKKAWMEGKISRKKTRRIPESGNVIGWEEFLSKFFPSMLEMDVGALVRSAG